jgi:hypothetical protein
VRKSALLACLFLAPHAESPIDPRHKTTNHQEISIKRFNSSHMLGLPQPLFLIALPGRLHSITTLFGAFRIADAAGLV